MIPSGGRYRSQISVCIRCYVVTPYGGLEHAPSGDAAGDINVRAVRGCARADHRYRIRRNRRPSRAVEPVGIGGKDAVALSGKTVNRRSGNRRRLILNRNRINRVGCPGAGAAVRRV